MTFAENINRICAKKGTNLTAVIKQIKNGQSAYTTAINKKGSIPNQEELLKLAEILECSVMDFFVDEEDLTKEDLMKRTGKSDKDSAAGSRRLLIKGKAMREGFVLPF